MQNQLGQCRRQLHKRMQNQPAVQGSAQRCQAVVQGYAAGAQTAWVLVLVQRGVGGGGRLFQYRWTVELRWWTGSAAAADCPCWKSSRSVLMKPETELAAQHTPLRWLPHRAGDSPGRVIMGPGRLSARAPTRTLLSLTP
jgi:hypothetical protein